MNKKILSLILCFIIATVVVSGVYATQNMDNNTESNEINELIDAVNSSNVLRSRENIVYVDSVTNNAENTESTREISAYTLQSNTGTENKSKEINDYYKIYKVSFQDDMQTLETYLNKANELWMTHYENDGIISFAFLQKGEDYNAQCKKINALNISQNRKEKMLQTARIIAGKWHVSHIEEQKNYEKASQFVTEGEIKNLIAENAICNIEEMKYIFIGSENMLAIWVNTDEGEYIIPYFSGEREDDLTSNEVYELLEFIGYTLY